MPGRAAGDGAAAALVLLQPLRDVVAGPATSSSRSSIVWACKPSAHGAAGARHRRIVPGSDRPPSGRAGRAPRRGSGARLLPRRRLGVEARRAGSGAAAPSRASGGAEAWVLERLEDSDGAGGHLSADRSTPIFALAAWATPRTTRGPLAVSELEPGDRGGRHARAAALLLGRLGHRAGHARLARFGNARITRPSRRPAAG